LQELLLASPSVAASPGAVRVLYTVGRSGEKLTGSFLVRLAPL